MFKYPKLRRVGDAFARAIREENEDMSPDDLEQATREKLEKEGLFSDVEGGFDGNTENLVEEDYTDGDIMFDMNQVSWEQAFLKLQELQKEKQMRELMAVKEADRLKLQEEFERK